jgi:phosphoenolpyruvate carboxykinase (ATP)
LLKADFRTDETFGFEVPTSLQGVDAAILDPRSTWADGAAYDEQAAKLADMFIENFAVYEAHVDADVLAAAPKSKVPA